MIHITGSKRLLSRNGNGQLFILHVLHFSFQPNLFQVQDNLCNIFDDTRDYILREKPDILILSGPPIYLLGFALEEKDLENARKNLIKIVKEVPRVVVDHHLLRDLRYAQFLESIKKETGKKVWMASELIGEKPYILEARRKELYYPKK